MTRRGVATIWALIVLALATTVTFALIGQLAATRTTVDRLTRAQQAELIADHAEWLALRKRKVDPQYRGETMKLTDSSETTVTVSGSKIEIEVKVGLPGKPHIARREVKTP